LFDAIALPRFRIIPNKALMQRVSWVGGLFHDQLRR
jgi:hypothetical protein